MFFRNCSRVSCLLFTLILSNVYNFTWSNTKVYGNENHFNEMNKNNRPEIKSLTDIRKVNEERRNFNDVEEEYTKKLAMESSYNAYYTYTNLYITHDNILDHNSTRLIRNGNEEEIGELARNSHLLKHRSTRQIKRSDCRSFGTCEKNYGKQIPNCFCDSECINYKDCCQDAPYLSSSLTTNKTILKFEFMICQAIKIPSMIYVDNVGFYMVSMCPETTLFNSKYLKCLLGSNEELPVTDHDGVTYRNSDCAHCHGVTSYEFWNIIVDLRKCGDFFFSIDTKDIQKKIQLLIENNCKVYWVPPNFFLNPSLKFPRLCITGQIGTYSQNQECNSYMNRVIIYKSSDFYQYMHARNVDCLSASQSYSCLQAYDAYELFTLEGSKVSRYPPLTVLFNFNTKQDCPGRENTMDTSWNANCQEETFLNYILESNITLESIGMASTIFFRRAMLMFYFSLPFRTFNMTIYDHQWDSRGKVVCGINSVSPNTNCCISITSLHIKFRVALSHSQIEQIKLSVLKMKYVYKESQKTKPYEHLQAKRKLHEDINMCDFGSNFTSEDNYLLTLKHEYILVNILFTDTQPKHINSKQFPNDSFCDVSIAFKKDSTEHRLEDIVEMRILNWTVSVLQFKETLTIDDVTKTILTYLTMSISTLALFVTVGIYIYFGISKSFAGNVCTNVMITLIIANLLYMFGVGAIDDQLICSVLGIILHYIWLCVFNWISLYTVLVTKILTMIDKNPAFKIDQSIRKRTIYCLGYGLPVLIVVPCIVLENFQVDWVKVKYGGSVCFLSGYLANIVFFAGPVVASLSFNFILLMIALKMLKKYNYSVINMCNKRTLQYVFTFIKLCLISGLFWIFGILSESIHNDLFEYLFIIITGLQGLTVCLCFLTSVHVCSSFRTCSSKKHDANESQ